MERMDIRSRLKQEDGVGMVLVIGIATVILAIMFTGAALADNSLGISRTRTDYERSLSAAESGIDQTLSRLQRAYDEYNSDFPIPAPASATFPEPVCPAATVTQPDSFATPDAERDWAANQIKSLVAAHPECVQTTQSGQYAVLKPSTPLVDGRYPGFGRVYSMGWSPNRTAKGASSRLVKAEYVFLPYVPQQAILTSGNLMIDSSTTVSAATGYDPSVAGVHSNGVISTVGNPAVYGKVTSTGTSSAQSNRFYSNPDGSVASAPTNTVPRVSARSFYFHAPNSDAVAVNSRWYDLCPDGSVKAWSASGPCTGAANGSSSTIGWSYDAPSRTWIAGRSSVSGVFYVHEGNVDVGTGNADIANITVIASSANAEDCASKRYGNISWNHYNMVAPALRNLFLYADADIVTFSNFWAGNSGADGNAVQSGMFVAGDQISMQTSSQGAVGSVIAADRCSTSPLVTLNEVKNPTVYFDPEGDSPFTDVINTTLWLEYDVS